MGKRRGRIQNGAMVFDAKPEDFKIVSEKVGAPIEESFLDYEAPQPGKAPQSQQRCRSFHPAMSELRCILPDGHDGEHSANGTGWVEPEKVLPFVATKPLDVAQELVPVATQPKSEIVWGEPAIRAHEEETKSPPRPRAEKTPEQIADDERRIKQVMEYLTCNGTLVRFAGYLFYAFKDRDTLAGLAPIVCRVWTEHDLIVWFNRAAKYMGKKGCTLHAALASTIPESRKHESVQAAAEPAKPEGSLWDVLNQPETP